MQLAAGSEHRINGRTVRINLAGPRPEQQQLQEGGVPLGEALPGLQSWQGTRPGWQAAPAVAQFGGEPICAVIAHEHILAVTYIRGDGNAFADTHPCVGIV